MTTARPLPPGSETEGQSGRAMTYALRNAGVSVLYRDRELNTVWSHDARPARPGGEAPDEADELAAVQRERIDAACRSVLATGTSQRFEISLRGEGGMRWFEIWVDADPDASGGIQGVVTTRIETTEQKRREQALRTLLREVSHRSRNLLAVIQSIASQTGRYSGTIPDFLTRLRGRLQSLASSQDLVTSSDWRGARLGELVAGQVGRGGPDPLKTLRFGGADPFLNPNAALHIGLAIHELAVNSASYGALSRPDGFVEVEAALEGPREGASLSLLWRERIAPGGRGTAARRFGSVTLERVVPASLNGTATLEIGNGRLEYRLLVPPGNFESD